jgi:hypothetical protein
MQQAVAKPRKGRHKTKAKIERFSLGEVRVSATARNRPQRVANDVFSAC